MSRLLLPYQTSSVLDAATQQQRELFYDTTNDEVRAGDGVTAGGRAIAWKDGSNLTGLQPGVSFLSTATGSDQLAGIQAIIDEVSAGGGGVIYAPPGQTYILNGRLTLKNNVDIYLNGSTFQFVGVNDGVDTQSTGLIANGDLSASGIVGFSGPLYKITDSASYYVRTSSKRQGLCNMRLIGRSQANPQGTGLQLRSDTGGSGISYVRFENVTILYFAAGAHLYQSGSGWVNDNIFEQLLISGCTTNHLYLQGNPCNNNEFHGLSIQPNTSLANATRAIECDGDENYIQGKVWDWDSSGSTLAVVFSGENNLLIDSGLPSTSYIKDKASERLDANIIHLRAGNRVYKTEGFFTPTDTENPSFNGHDDCLAWAHTLRTVTASGDAGTNPNNLFLPGEAVTSWASLTSATYKIDFGSSQSYLFAAGVKFAFGDIADNVTISYSDDDVSYTTLATVTGNFNHDVFACGKTFIGGTFRYIKFEISNDSGKATKISRLYAYTPAVRGREFISHDANNLLGTISSDMWTRVATGGRTGNDDANAQSVFDSATDTIALDANTLYDVEGDYVITRTAGTNSHTFAILFNYTGTVNYFLATVQVSNGNTGALAAVSQTRIVAITAATLTTANTSATECVIVKIKGTLRTTNAGAFTPQFQYSAAPGGAPTIASGSYFQVRRIGVNTAVSAGPWS